jgi:hypothetical protein
LLIAGLVLGAGGAMLDICEPVFAAFGLVFAAGKTLSCRCCGESKTVTHLRCRHCHYRGWWLPALGLVFGTLGAAAPLLWFEDETWVILAWLFAGYWLVGAVAVALMNVVTLHIVKTHGVLLGDLARPRS